MLISFDELNQRLKIVLLGLGFNPEKAGICAGIFASNSRDGVHSHGLNRFPVFVRNIKEGLIDKEAEPVLESNTGLIEHWNGQLAPGMYSASRCMDRSIALAKQYGLGCVSIRNTNHWMRGGTYGWQAADNQCIAICATNARANMPPWGGKTSTLGNNPIVIAVPRSQGHIVLDLALSQYSYGKLQEFELGKRLLPLAGGYDDNGTLTTDPSIITNNQRALPIGYWKGSGLSLLIDILVAGISGGRSVAQISKEGKEYGVSQFFLCIDAKMLNDDMLEEIISFTKQSQPVENGTPIRYPGEQTLIKRKKSEEEGIEVNDGIWEEVSSLVL